VTETYTITVFIPSEVLNYCEPILVRRMIYFIMHLIGGKGLWKFTLEPVSRAGIPNLFLNGDTLDKTSAIP
jgi:hypothetical protein